MQKLGLSSRPRLRPGRRHGLSGAHMNKLQNNRGRFDFLKEKKISFSLQKMGRQCSFGLSFSHTFFQTESESPHCPFASVSQQQIIFPLRMVGGLSSTSSASSNSTSSFSFPNIPPFLALQQHSNLPKSDESAQQKQYGIAHRKLGEMNPGQFDKLTKKKGSSSSSNNNIIGGSAAAAAVHHAPYGPVDRVRIPHPASAVDCSLQHSSSFPGITVSGLMNFPAKAASKWRPRLTLSALFPYLKQLHSDSSLNNNNNNNNASPPTETFAFASSSSSHKLQRQQQCRRCSTSGENGPTPSITTFLNRSLSVASRFQSSPELIRDLGLRSADKYIHKKGRGSKSAKECNQKTKQPKRNHTSAALSFLITFYA